MSARIFDIHDWRAAQKRRADREAAIIRSLYSGRPQPKGLSLDDILGPAFDPTGGAA
jgi:hypothetical protein